MRSNATIVLCILSLLLTTIGYINTSDAKIDESTIAGMWTFEDGQGETVTDESGNGSDGTFVGDLKWVDGKFGGGLEFNGTDTWVKIGTKGDADSLAALDFNQSEGFSIHAWVYSAVAPSGKCIVWKGLGCSSWSQYLLGTGAHEMVKILQTRHFIFAQETVAQSLKFLVIRYQKKSGSTLLVFGTQKNYIYM